LKWRPAYKAERKFSKKVGDGNSVARAKQISESKTAREEVRAK